MKEVGGGPAGKSGVHDLCSAFEPGITGLGGQRLLRDNSEPIRLGHGP